MDEATCAECRELGNGMSVKIFISRHALVPYVLPPESEMMKHPETSVNLGEICECLEVLKGIEHHI